MESVEGMRVRTMARSVAARSAATGALYRPARLEAGSAVDHSQIARAISSGHPLHSRKIRFVSYVLIAARFLLAPTLIVMAALALTGH